MKAIVKCRACGSKKLIEFLDLGDQYLSDFRSDDSKPPRYPLVAVFCDDCKLVQLAHTTSQSEMYHENYGFKSGVNEVIKADLDSVVQDAFQYVNDPKHWLDIGSNDGSLLSFIPKDIFRFGVDPVKFLCDEAREHGYIINDYFNHKVSEMLYFDPGPFDVITTVSCFYDMPDPNVFVEDVKKVLAHKGVWIIQQNYLLTTIELGAVDNFCHEHLTYYTLLSLENLLNHYGLEVNEVKLSMINGGSIRTVVSRKGTFPIDESVQRQRDIEEDWCIEDLCTYEALTERVYIELDKLKDLVSEWKLNDNKRIGVIAASTRGATIWQSAHIGRYIDYAIERNPAKVGKYFSAIGCPIISEEDALKLNLDVLIIGPWFLGDQIVERSRKLGKMVVVPLPQVEVI